MENQTDIVAKFNQVANETGQPAQLGRGQWIKKIEEFTFKYLDYLLAATKSNSRNEREINDLLTEITKIGEQLDENRSAQILPFIASLSFLKNQSLSGLDLAQAKQNVDSFQATSLTIEYRQLDEETQIGKLVEFGNGIRRIVEFALQSAAGENPQGGSSMTSLMHAKPNSEFAIKNTISQPNGQGLGGSNIKIMNSTGTGPSTTSIQQNQGTGPSTTNIQQNQEDPFGSPSKMTQGLQFTAPEVEKVETSIQTVGNNKYNCTIPPEVAQQYCKIRVEKLQNQNYQIPHYNPQCLPQCLPPFNQPQSYQTPNLQDPQFQSSNQDHQSSLPNPNFQQQQQQQCQVPNFQQQCQIPTYPHHQCQPTCQTYPRQRRPRHRKKCQPNPLRCSPAPLPYCNMNAVPPRERDTWAPIAVQGQGITDINEFPSLTQLHNIRELNVPGAKLFNPPLKTVAMDNQFNTADCYTGIGGGSGPGPGTTMPRPEQYSPLPPSSGGHSGGGGPTFYTPPMLTCKANCAPKPPQYKQLCNLNPYPRKPKTHTGYFNPAWNAYMRPPGFPGGAKPAPPRPPRNFYEDVCEMWQKPPPPPPGQDPVTCITQAIRRSIQGSLNPAVRKSSIPAQVDNLVQQVLASPEVRDVVAVASRPDMRSRSVQVTYDPTLEPDYKPPPVMVTKQTQATYDPTLEPDYVPPPVLASKRQQTNPSYSVNRLPPVDEI